MPVFDPERKRSPRGELRIASLLHAAAHIFGSVGYHAATTNAIAAEASVSPATLYQFFPNKDALADALAAQYSIALAAEERDLDLAPPLSLDDAVSRLLNTVITFHRKYPAFRALLTEAPLSPSILDQKHLLSQTFVERLAGILTARNPALPSAEALWHAGICLTILKGFLDPVAGRKTPTRRRIEHSLHQVLVRYLQPLLTSHT
jgi:AcrR family transcriptional regulator